MLGEGAARRENIGVRGGRASGDHRRERRAMKEVVVHRERCTEIGDRFVDEARFVLRLAEVVPGAGVPGLQRGGVLQLDDRRGFLTGVQQRRAQPEMDLEAVRTESLRPPEVLERIGEPPLPHELGAELELARGSFSCRLVRLVLIRHTCSLAAGSGVPTFLTSLEVR